MKRWSLLVACVAAATAVLSLVGAPAAYLLGALVGALVVALTVGGPQVPARAGTVGQAVIGASVGTLVTADLLTTLARHGWVIGLALLFTMVSSLAWGQVLRYQPGVSAVTASFASIAGGASGVVATARDVGADEPVVATIQYLRVLVVLFTMPVVAKLYDPAASTAGPGMSAGGNTWAAYGFSLVALAIGLALLRFLDFPGAAVLVPMLATAALVATGWFPDTVVPAPVLNAGYVVIGVQVGLKFTRTTLGILARLLPLAFVQVAGTILTCAAAGWLMAELTDIGQLDAYLATTPGGLYAVIAVAISTGSDTGLVFSLQVLRLFASLLLVPLLARLHQPPRARPTD
ncbi:AbrB family transcriptional regulator [Nocardioides iriomotensis]|uniref:AbrB family transcriptional regulator n=1 Tax=Nocardioides iriomotensis TaxID=715784 RepID=A0A4Q5IV78_9ACTN|nr:AbrB family transcriptional regulator [Nocardioides iriomotensis]RYU08861.1 AbrB family transcriptional regulator [Nocardioides iriomotensis]